MAATTSSTEEVYPDEIQKLLKDSKYKDACSITLPALVIRREKFTEKNRLAVEKELSSMKTLCSRLVSLRVASDRELETLSEIENSSLQQLAKDVPNIQEMPQYSVFTYNQRLTIKTALIAEKHKEIANYDPDAADAVKELFSKIEPLELARILKVSLSQAEELKKSSQTTSSVSQEPSQAPKDPEATTDSQKQAQKVEVSSSLDEELKKSSQTTSSDSQEPSQAPKGLEATVDSQKRAQKVEVPLDLAEELKESLQIAFQTLEDQEAQKSAQTIEDICGKLQSIPPRIKELHELVCCCLDLVQQFDYYISVLEYWLNEAAAEKEREEAAKKEIEEKIIRRKGNASENEKEKNISRQKENATKKDIKWECVTNIRKSWKY